jgi:hypothetical protein
MNLKTQAPEISQIAQGRRLTSLGAIVEANRLGLTILFNGGNAHLNVINRVEWDGTRVWKAMGETDGTFVWANPLVATTNGKFGEFHTFADPKTGEECRLLVDKEYWRASGLLAMPQGFDGKGNSIIRVEGKNGKRIESLEELERHSIATCVVDDASNFTLIQNVARDPFHHPTESKFGIPIDAEPDAQPREQHFHLIRIEDRVISNASEETLRELLADTNKINTYKYLGLFARGYRPLYVCAFFPPSQRLQALAYKPQAEQRME